MPWSRLNFRRRRGGAPSCRRRRCIWFRLPRWRGMAASLTFCGRIEIGLAGGQADHVAAVRLEGARLGGDGDGLAGTDAVEAFRAVRCMSISGEKTARSVGRALRRHNNAGPDWQGNRAKSW